MRKAVGAAASWHLSCVRNAFRTTLNGSSRDTIGTKLSTSVYSLLFLSDPLSCPRSLQNRDPSHPLIVLLILPVCNLTVPHSDYNSLIRTQALKQQQLRCNSEIRNKLHVIELRLNVINLLRLPRWHRGEIIIHRLRIGHTHLTHGLLLRGETHPRCLACQV